MIYKADQKAYLMPASSLFYPLGYIDHPLCSIVCEAIHINNNLLPSKTLIYHVVWFLNRTEQAPVLLMCVLLNLSVMLLLKCSIILLLDK